MTRQYDTSNVRPTNCELRSAVRSYTLPSCDLASPTGRVIGSDFSFGRGRHTIAGYGARPLQSFSIGIGPGNVSGGITLALQ